LDPDKMPVTEISTLISDLEAQEDYEAYLEIDGGSTQQVQILGNAVGDEWMTVISIEGESYLTYVKGTINWLQLPKVYEAISTQDSEGQTGFSILLNFFGEDRRRRQIQREWQQKKEDKQR